MRRVLWLVTLLGVAFSAASCERYPEQLDYGVVCVSSTDSGAAQRLQVMANSRDCAVDHRGASFRCEIEVAEEPSGALRIRTFFQDGKDPNGGCPGPLTAECSVDIEPGERLVRFAEDELLLTFPLTSPACLPPDTDPNEL